MSTDKLKVGIIGSMFAADLHMSAYSRLPHVEAVAVAAKTEDEARPFAQKWGIKHIFGDYKKMLQMPELDAISVAVPNFLHHDVVLEVVKAKKPMICEKPLATSLKDALDMADAVKKSGLTFMYAEDWIFAPSLVRAAQVVEEGGIGDVLYCKAKETHNGSHSPFAQQKKYCGGGAMIHLGIHPLGWVRWLKKQEVVEVFARVSGGEAKNLLHKNYTGEDWSCAIVTFEDGTSALIEGNYITWGGIDDRIEIYGSEGNLHINLTQGSPVSCYSRKGIKYAIEKTDMTVGWTKPAVDEWWQLGYCDEIAKFIDCVRFKQPVPRGVGLDDGVACMRIIDAIYRSAESGKVEKVK